MAKKFNTVEGFLGSLGITDLSGKTLDEIEHIRLEANDAVVTGDITKKLFSEIDDTLNAAVAPTVKDAAKYADQSNVGNRRVSQVKAY